MPGNSSEVRDNNYIPVGKWQDSTDPTKTLPILVNENGYLLCEI